MYWLLLPNVPNAQFLVTGGRDKQGAIRTPRHRLYYFVNIESEFRGTGFDVPDLYGKVTGRGSKDVLGSRVEQNMADFPSVPVSLNDYRGIESLLKKVRLLRMTWKSADWSNILDLFCICVQSESLRHSPKEYLQHYM